MGRAMGITLGVAVVAAGIGSGCGEGPVDAMEWLCFAVWENLLPPDARLTGFEQVGRELRVRYRHSEGTGEVRCDTRADGSFDDTASINRKADFLWDHPEVVPRL